MIERASDASHPAAAVPLAADAAHLSAGALLRQAREGHGVRLDALAAVLKVPVQKLDALENDQIDRLPDPVFARALAASVCRALRVDPKPVLARMTGAPVAAGLADADKTLGAARLQAGGGRSGSGGWRASRLLTGVVGLLLVAAAALYFLPQSTLDGFSASLNRTLQRGAAPQAGTAEGAAQQDAGSDTATPGTVVEPVSGTGHAAGAPPAEAVAAPPVAAASQAPAPGTDALVFTVRGDSWITVTDAHHTVLLKRKVAAGEKVGVSGTLPLTVVLGRAAGVDVQVHGQPFDLKPFVRPGGTAHFQVKP